MKPTYEGDLRETGGTSMNFRGGAAPAIRVLYEKGHITEGMNVLDYGAGKYDRNAKFLRDQGVNVWSYDPYHGSIYVDGWNGVSSVVEEDAHFDLVFTSFVLNVVPNSVENMILRNCARFADTQYHIVRADLLKYVTDALFRIDPTVTDFYNNEYLTTLTDLGLHPKAVELISDFCYFGTKTSRGFQRTPQLEEKDFDVMFHRKNAYTIYTK